MSKMNEILPLPVCLSNGGGVGGMIYLGRRFKYVVVNWEHNYYKENKQNRGESETHLKACQLP